jgi:hypothetical protein
MSDCWVEIDELGQAFLIDELDGRAYLCAPERGDVLRSRYLGTVTRIQPGDQCWRAPLQRGPVGRLGDGQPQRSLCFIEAAGSACPTPDRRRQRRKIRAHVEQQWREAITAEEVRKLRRFIQSSWVKGSVCQRPRMPAPEHPSCCPVRPVNGHCVNMNAALRLLCSRFTAPRSLAACSSFRMRRDERCEFNRPIT